MWDLLGLIVFGAVIGVLARLFRKGSQPIGMLWTVLLGMAGALVGYWVAGAIGVGDTFGVDWIRWIISVAAAIVFISIYLGATGRRSR